nr:hypothetical protein CFP56_77286 [Quercus suber]
MGNCLRRESSSMVWAGDDWGSLNSSKNHHDAMLAEADHDHKGNNVERHRLLGNMSSSSASAGNNHAREVKIKITKKELEELVNMQGLSMEQILARLAEAADDSKYELERQRSWKPALQSIPELQQSRYQL